VRSILTGIAVAVVMGSAVLAQGPVYKVGAGVKSPVLVKEVKPKYSEVAMRRKVQGTVQTSAVVLADGKVGDVSITRSLDEDLDQEAIKAVKQWRFKPATKDGKAVAVEVEIELTFTLRDQAKS